VKKLLAGQAFTIGLVCVICLAYWFPEHGLEGGSLGAEYTTLAGVALIFFLQGLTLSSASLRKGFTAWRLHLFVLFFGFVFLPLAIWFVVERGWVPERVAPGLMFLAILPTTISTSVIYSAESKGDASAATFCAVLSNLLAIFVVPAWAAYLIFPGLAEHAPGDGDTAFLTHFLWRLFWLIAFPLFVGLFSQRFLHRFVAGKEGWVRKTCFACVLFIAYAGFCKGVDQRGDSFGGDFFQEVFFWTFAFVLFSNLAAVMALRFSRLSWPLVITGFFAATQKSLAVGLPMAYLLFGQGNLDILFPLIVCHPVQLLLGAALCSRLRSASSRSS